LKYLYDSGWLTTKYDEVEDIPEEQPKRVNPYAA
jgi:hypothetical protein